MAERIDAALSSHDLALRQDLFPASWEMFLQKPVAGWGPVNHQYELETRVPRAELPYRETHTVFLELLTETGLVGAIPFVAAMVLCVVAGWRGRMGTLGALPVALAVAVIVHRMSTAGLYTKAHWLALALALAAGAAAPRRSS
jgi:O-antigen ligase